MRDLLQLLEDKNKPEKLELLSLSWSESALTPVIGSGCVRQHKKLWQGYVDKFNDNIGDRQFQYAGYLLHNLYFTQFRSPRTNNEPNGPVGGMIKSRYKSWEDFKEAFKTAALKLQGSGWVYLSRDGSIKTIQNHAVRPDILILVDMWEHAYQMDYGTHKEKYLDNIWRVFDWNSINTRWGQAYK